MILTEFDTTMRNHIQIIIGPQSYHKIHTTTKLFSIINVKRYINYYLV